MFLGHFFLLQPTSLADRMHVFQGEDWEDPNRSSRRERKAHRAVDDFGAVDDWKLAKHAKL